MLTLWPPSMRPTDRLGGPRIGSGVDRDSVLGERLEDIEDAAHPVDGVDAPVGRRAVTGEPPGADLPPQGPLVAMDQVEQGRLGDDRQLGTVVHLRQPRRPGVGKFLVDRAGQEHRRRAGRPLSHQPGEGREHRRHAPLDVARAPAVEPPRRRSPARTGGSSCRRSAPYPDGRRRGSSAEARGPRTTPAGCRGPVRPAADGRRRPVRETRPPGSRSAGPRGRLRRRSAAPSD